jgi:predicted nucleic acid-binding protein
LIAADTSVVVAAFASWHEGHEAALRALRRGVRLPAQVLVESYSVLTRLPPPHRAGAAVVESFLAERFPGAPLTLPGNEYRALLRAMAAAEVAGGAIYDALIAATAEPTRTRRTHPAPRRGAGRPERRLFRGAWSWMEVYARRAAARARAPGRLGTVPIFLI